MDDLVINAIEFKASETSSALQKKVKSSSSVSFFL